ncbi:MAG: hypothetical protein ACK4MS_08365 [Paracoccaceae bacterium]
MNVVIVALAILYGLVALFALYMTHQEHRWNKRVGPLSGPLGYVLCLFWPIMIVVMAFAIILQRRSA